MIIWNVAKTQWLRLLRNNLSRLAILAILFIPLLYCGLYLYAFWNPYGALHKLPVALVMEDKGGVYHGEHVNYGEELAKQLQKKIDLRWETVSSQIAEKGIAGDRYYLVVKIPVDFTQRSLSITSSKPVKSQLVFIRNEGKNYIAGTIASRIESEMASEVSNTFTNQYVENILSLLLQAKSGISQAAEGANQLSAGAEKLETGLDLLQQALHKAAEGAKKVDRGSAQFVTGTSQLVDGTNKVASGTHQLALEADKINDVITKLKSVHNVNTDKIKTEITNIKTAMMNLEQDLEASLADHPERKPLLDQVSMIKNRVDTIEHIGDQLDTVVSKINNLQVKLQQIKQLDKGANQVAFGAKQLNNGAKELKKGTTALNNGLQEIIKPLPQMIIGAKKLKEGNKKLADKLTQATKEQQADPSTLSSIISNPIEILDQSIYKVNLYGVGLAPYFLPLSLWIGGLMLYFAVPASELRWRLYPSHPWFIQIGKLLTFVPFGIFQSMVTGIVIHYVLGLPIKQPFFYYLFLLCISFMSIALIGALISLLGSGPGRLVSIVLLVLQLVSSGGTFPVDLIPHVFQVISPLLPMSYGVNGLRHIIVYHQPAELIKPFMMILLYLIGSLALTFLGQRRKFRISELQERDQLTAG
ncbi:YhgE/Pip domain-containing protein [Shimazuella kribbensis]|uniref:YhgE/Pip domain-containing protein n=1 Tax=Shimazuella kribbensis TaxID=139808 RepID=UPI0003F52429|nr:YhgE/Pip domain-containing protein [Shimazuella kribbensis]